ncbi:hypothetical protein K8R03_01555 [Candidatus Kaiserbacteria bacterium]|nr:hypothetical protein [Candidatus Kaiserbacteria bacterium]
MPAPITVTIQFDTALQKVTRTAGHPVVMSQAASFAFLLMSVMEEYPDIMRMYPPGTLAVTLNGKRPETYSPLFDGDVVRFLVPKTA